VGGVQGVQGVHAHVLFAWQVMKTMAKKCTRSRAYSPEVLREEVCARSLRVRGLGRHGGGDYALLHGKGLGARAAGCGRADAAMERCEVRGGLSDDDWWRGLSEALEPCRQLRCCGSR